MRIRFTLFGREVWCLEIGRIVAEDEGETDEFLDAHIKGGETHNFERDTTPLDPADHYGSWEWEDRNGFGFTGGPGSETP